MLSIESIENEINLAQHSVGQLRRIVKFYKAINLKLKEEKIALEEQNQYNENLSLIR